MDLRAKPGNKRQQVLHFTLLDVPRHVMECCGNLLKISVVQP